MTAPNLEPVEPCMISNELILFVRDSVKYKGDLPIGTDLYGDLKLCGSDAEDFLANLAKRFHVSLSQFRFDSYFYRASPFVFVNPFRVKKYQFYLSVLQNAIDCGNTTNIILKKLIIKII